MKKVVKPVLFFFGVLAICAGGAVVNVASSGDFFPIKHADVQVHAISVEADQRIMVKVSESASSGDVVDVTLEYDENNIVVDEISVNSGKAIRLSEKAFQFVMPNEDVVLSVKSRIANQETAGFALNNIAADKGVVLVGLPSRALGGEEMSFKVQFAADSGYTFTDKVEVYTIGEDGERNQDVQVAAMAGTYTFTMPESDIAISVGLEEKIYFMTKSSTNSSNISKIETWNGSEFKSTYGSSVFAKYNSPVRVTLADTTTAHAVGLSVDGVTMLLEEESVVIEFKMPKKDITLEAIVERLYKPIQVNNSEHVTLTLVELVDGEWVPLTENKATPTYDVYVKAVSSDPSKYGASVPTVLNGTSSVSCTLHEKTDSYTIYTFLMKNSDEMSVTANEQEIPYINYGFAGAFYGANIYPTSMSGVTYKFEEKNFTTSYNFSNEGGKSINYKNKAYEIEELTGDENGGFIKFNNGTYGIAYGKDIVYGYYSGSLSLLSKPDAMVSYKIPSGTYSDYTFNCLHIKNTTSTDNYADYMLIQVWNKSTNTEVGCAVLNYDFDFSTGDYSPMYQYLNDISFEFNSSDIVKISDSNLTSVTIKQNGETIFNVTKNETNGTIVYAMEKAI